MEDVKVTISLEYFEQLKAQADKHKNNTLEAKLMAALREFDKSYWYSASQITTSRGSVGEDQVIPETIYRYLVLREVLK